MAKTSEKRDVEIEAVEVAAPSGMDYEAYLEGLKTRNPAKYEVKKAELEARVGVKLA